MSCQAASATGGAADVNRYWGARVLAAAALLVSVACGGAAVAPQPCCQPGRGGAVRDDDHAQGPTLSVEIEDAALDTEEFLDFRITIQNPTADPIWVGRPAAAIVGADIELLDEPGDGSPRFRGLGIPILARGREPCGDRGRLGVPIPPAGSLTQRYRTRATRPPGAFLVVLALAVDLLSEDSEVITPSDPGCHRVTRTVDRTFRFVVQERFP